MFKFKDLSEPEEDKFDPQEFQLEPKEFMEKQRNEQQTQVFDLREKEEFDEYHLYGAYHLPLENFEYAIYQMPFNSQIFLYSDKIEDCTQAAEILYENGMDNFNFLSSYEGLIQYFLQSEITVTDSAQPHISQTLEEDSSLIGIRIKANPISLKKAKYSIGWVKKDEDLSKDQKIQVQAADDRLIDAYLDLDSLMYLEGTIVDFAVPAKTNEEDEGEKELIINNPNWEVVVMSGSSEREIMEKLLEEEINPMVASHGGFIDLIDIKDNRVYLEFGGGCKGCGMVDVTLKQGVQVMVKENLPNIIEILDVTDHADGTNPYYQPGK